MFRSARFTLTAWYLLIIMTISILFSLFIYRGITQELYRVARVERFRIEHPDSPEMRAPFPAPPVEDQQLLDETKGRVQLTLLLINLLIFFGAGFAGYFLAGKTLAPIEDMVEEQNRFIADASHEFRTPLTSLRTAIEVDLRNKKLSSQEVKKLLEENLDDVKNLQLLSDGLLQLAQYQDKKEELAPSRISLSKVLSSSVKSVGRLAKNKHIGVVLKKNKYNVRGDEKSLIDLFTIFLDNAIKYSKQNGKILIAAERTDGKVKVTIRDFGIGISPEELPHLFDRFYRADKSRTQSASAGYGLGLSIAQKILTFHGGSVSVRSELKKGTTFTILLPIA